MINILIVDDMIDIANYFSMILSNEKDTEVVGIATSGKQAVEMALRLKPDVILMDIQMEYQTAGIDAIQAIKTKIEAVKIIVLTIHENDELLFAAFASGADNFINKTVSISEILDSIRSVYNNDLVLKPQISSKVLKEFAKIKCVHQKLISTLNVMNKLTNTEFEILKMLHEGKKYSEIADERSVEDVTIRTHISKILKKFNEKKIKDVVELLDNLNVFDLYKQ